MPLEGEACIQASCYSIFIMEIQAVMNVKKMELQQTLPNINGVKNKGTETQRQ
jgi:hypothetical protein